MFPQTVGTRHTGPACRLSHGLRHRPERPHGTARNAGDADLSLARLSFCGVSSISRSAIEVTQRGGRAAVVKGPPARGTSRYGTRRGNASRSQGRPAALHADRRLSRRGGNTTGSQQRGLVSPCQGDRPPLNVVRSRVVIHPTRAVEVRVPTNWNSHRSVRKLCDKLLSSSVTAAATGTTEPPTPGLPVRFRHRGPLKATCRAGPAARDPQNRRKACAETFLQLA